MRDSIAKAEAENYHKAIAAWGGSRYIIARLQSLIPTI
jgi:hypothetical protein